MKLLWWGPGNEVTVGMMLLWQGPGNEVTVVRAWG